jgi:hypothetical protein
VKPKTATQLAARRKGIDAALRRAAAEARELAMRTQTPLFVMRHGKIVDLNHSIPKTSVQV